MLRVIAGKYKNFRLEEPNPLITRPTKDIAKGGVFSSLNNISNYTFLDLFSGSGSIGIEALSRGCEYVVFNEINSQTYKILLKNIDKLNISEKYKCYKEDAFNLITLLSKNGNKFDVIYLDPPYSYKYSLDLINLIIQSNILNSNGIIIFETDKVYDFNILIDFKIKLFKYGITNIYMLRSLI